MTLSSKSPTILHILQNLSLILLSIISMPICTSIALLSCIVAPFTEVSTHIKHNQRWRTTPSCSRPRTILVTGVGMSKGLALARTFYRAGHRVIGADFEPYGIPVAGRFSTSLDKFYRLSTPSSATGGVTKYFEELVELIQQEKVDIWVSCSGVASAVEDGLAAEAVERFTECKPIQLRSAVTEILHGKHTFIEYTKMLGLNVPETHLIVSVEDALNQLHPGPIPETSDSGRVQKRYIMKSISLDDSLRGNMTLLPRPSFLETELHLSRLEPSSSRWFVLQQFISGPEYCTHSLIIKGKVLAFTACRSSELLMHYQALSSTCPVAQAMLKYHQVYANKIGPSMNGHFSIDFILNEGDGAQEEDLMQRIYPIECNPRAHTAAVLFADDSEDLAEAYLSILPDYFPTFLSDSSHDNFDIITPSTTAGYYWIGHDLVTLVILPFWEFAMGKIDMLTFLFAWMQFVEHLLFWRDGTFEIWDPWPAWWLYCGYWPGMFVVTLLTQRWWSRCNVSTTKMFKC